MQIDKDRAVDGVDFSKVFDKVLVHNIKIYGIHRALIVCLQDGLAHKRQKVVVGGCDFGWRAVTSGPQGSVLVPLFVVCIKCSDVNLDQLVSKFAENAKICSCADNEEGCQKMQWDMDQLQKRVEK